MVKIKIKYISFKNNFNNTYKECVDTMPYRELIVSLEFKSNEFVRFKSVSKPTNKHMYVHTYVCMYINTYSFYSFLRYLILYFYRPMIVSRKIETSFSLIV